MQWMNIPNSYDIAQDIDRLEFQVPLAIIVVVALPMNGDVGFQPLFSQGLYYCRGIFEYELRAKPKRFHCTDL